MLLNVLQCGNKLKLGNLIKSVTYYLFPNLLYYMYIY